MPIKFQCGHCGAPIKAPDTHAGQTLPCPKCGQPVLVMADVVAPPLPQVQPSAPPVASAPPAVAPPSVVVPPAAQVVAAEEEEPDAMPAIVTRDAPPALDFVGAASAASEPYASPRTRSSRVNDVELQNVRVVDVRMSWGSMFRMVFQFYVCVLALSMVVGLAFLIVSMLLALVGIGVSGTVGCVPFGWWGG